MRKRRRSCASFIDNRCFFFVFSLPILCIHVISTLKRTNSIFGTKGEPNLLKRRDPRANNVGEQRPWMSASYNQIQSLKLRYNWTSLRRLSPLARAIEDHQNDCNLGKAYFRFRNRFGLGSDLHVYSQALCNALEAGTHRVSTILDWIWLDQEACHFLKPSKSPMLCYFPGSEPSCSDHSNSDWTTYNLTRGRGRISNVCSNLTAKYGTPAIRAASTEFLFTQVSHTVQNEATRQLHRVFMGHQKVPHGLITVHIRWGDKSDEMTLLPIESYIDGVRRLLTEDQGRPAHVLLATEDPKAVQAFEQAAPSNWRIFVDHYFHEMLPHRNDVYNGSPLMSKELNGRPGLVALGSLLVSMEANAWVLTTNSNWSRLMNEIRTNIINPRCGNCTRMIDLSEGEW